MDKWIVSLTQSLLIDVKREMKEYRLHNVNLHLIKYIDNLTNWYVRMNKKRIQGKEDLQDWKNALMALFFAVYTMVYVYAPFTPFLTEFMYQKLLNWIPTINMFESQTFNTLEHFRNYCESVQAKFNPNFKWQDSVHYKLIPYPLRCLLDKNIEKAILYMQSVIQLGRIARNRKLIPKKKPLPEIIVIHENDKILKAIDSKKSYILEELNITELTTSTDKEKYDVILNAEPNYTTLCNRLNDENEQLSQAIKELSEKQLQKFIITNEITVRGYKFEKHELRLISSFTGSTAEKLSQQYESHSDGDILILLDVTEVTILQEVINGVKELRKKARFVSSDKVVVYYEIADTSSNLTKTIANYKEFIEDATMMPLKEGSNFHMAQFSVNAVYTMMLEDVQIRGVNIRLALVKTEAISSIGMMAQRRRNSLSTMSTRYS